VRRPRGRRGAAALATAGALALAAGGVVLTAGVAQAAAGELVGRLALVEGRKAATGAEAAVVWFVPDARRPPPPPATFVMETHRKRFEPRVLVVPVGSSVRFPNRDPILHNVFSVSGGNTFDLGLLPQGDGGTARFRQAGVVRVFCNVHHRMVGYVVVVDTPFHASPDAAGRFRLAGLPPGPGELVVWHERAEPSSRRVDPAAGPVSLSLELTRPQVPPHLNKLGRPYERNRRDRY
jgi:plastocyanin